MFHVCMESTLLPAGIHIITTLTYFIMAQSTILLLLLTNIGILESVIWTQTLAIDLPVC